jgi:hypothetical protein
MLPFPVMRKLRVHMSQVTFQWLCIVAMAGVIIWLIYGVNHAAERAGGVQVVPNTLTRADEPVSPLPEMKGPAPSHPKKRIHTQLGKETPRQEAAVQPVVQRQVDYPAAAPPPAPVPALTPQEVQQKLRQVFSAPAPQPAPVVAPSSGLGMESGSVAVKKYMRPDDGVYRGKVVRCEGAGGAGPWSGWSNAGTLCLDVGESFIRVKFDGQVWVTEPGGDRRWKPTQLEVNDVIRATINDGTMIRAEAISNVRDE